MHHGAYFLSLALTARRDEQLWALDIFEEQGKNVDHSGKGDFGIFSENVKAIGIDAKDILVTKKASTEFNVSDLCDFVPQRFRFLSIDGGHTREIVYNDLKFAECVWYAAMAKQQGSFRGMIDVVGATGFEGASLKDAIAVCEEADLQQHGNHNSLRNSSHWLTYQNSNVTRYCRCYLAEGGVASLDDYTHPYWCVAPAQVQWP